MSASDASAETWTPLLGLTLLSPSSAVSAKTRAGSGLVGDASAEPRRDTLPAKVGETKRLDHRLEHRAAVDAAKQRFAGAFRMRHHADDVSRLVADTRDGVDRSVGIPGVVDHAVRIGIAQHDLTVPFD